MMNGDMRTFPIRLLLLMAVMPLCLVNPGCRRAAPEQSDDTWVRVIDGATQQGIVGAGIYPQCMGGTPYATNKYLTDAHGSAIVDHPYFGPSSGMMVRIKKEGYEDGWVIMPVTNHVVSLKRLQL
jgi:hypothetical protein